MTTTSASRKQLWHWSIAVGVAMVGLALLALEGLTAGGQKEGGPAAIALLTAAFVAAELLVVHVHLGKNTQSFSLVEIPLVIGLLLVNPASVVVAYMIGTSAVLVRRQQPPLKLVFNAGSFCLTASLTALIFHALAPNAESTDVAAWISIAIATCCAAVVGGLLVSTMMAIAVGRVVWRQVASGVAFVLAVTVAATSIGISGAILIDAMPLSMVFLAIPVAALYFANRAYVSELERRQSLELLYEASRGLSDEPELETALLSTLQRLQDALGTDVAELLLAGGASDSCTSLRVSAIEGSEQSLSHPIQEMHALLHRCGLTQQQIDSWTMRLPDDSAPGESPGNFFMHDSHELIAALCDVEGLLGVISVRKTQRSSRRFSDDDMATFHTISRNVAAHLRLAHQATHDALTGLPNRRMLERRMRASFAMGRSQYASLLLLDIDDFKTVNDTFGHEIGDQLLVNFGLRLADITGGTATVSRLGGDEFAVFCDVSTRAWEDIAQAIVLTLAEPVLCGERAFAVKSSIGVALGRQCNNHVTLYRNADTALYEAKRNGKSQFQLFADSMYERVARRFHVADDLGGAIERGELRIVMQPIVDLRNGAIVGAESLARWNHPDFGNIPPNEFVAVAEENGMSTVLSQFVVDQTARMLPAIDGVGYVSVNVSPIDLRDADFIEQCIDVARRNNNMLAIEVTERSIVGDSMQLRSLRRLRDNGVRVFIDDFGTQYSSLSYLRNVPADALKIPKEFTDQLMSGPDAVAMVRAVIAIAHALGLAVVAEGVETADQAAILRELKCEYAQGYYYARPQEIVDMRAGFKLQAA